jgi:hypothetical protein
MTIPPVQGRKASYYVVRLDSYFGQQTALSCLDVVGDGCTERDCQFCVVLVQRDGAEVVDYGYRSIKEAKQAWPGAI